MPDNGNKNPDDNAGAVAPPPLVFAAGLLFGLLVNRKLRLGFLPEEARKPVGLPLLAAGLALGGWFFVRMRASGTSVDPYKPVSKLVTDGPFRLSRNPAYVAFVAVYLGVAALKNSLPSLLLFPLVLRVISRGVIEREEAYLRRKFGAEYEAYAGRVRRWL